MSAQLRWHLGLAGLLVAGLATIAALAGDYGLGWDEAVQWKYGELALAYFGSGFRDRSFETFLNLRDYGAIFEMGTALVARTSPEHALALRHACIALCGLATVLATALIGRRLGGPVAGLAAGLLVAIDPPFFGHAFQNSKDVPFAAGFAWTVLAASRFLGARRPTARDALLLGAAAGLALSVRIGGVLLLAAVLASGGMWTILVHRAALRPARLLGLLGLAAAVAWVLTVAFWPWAHLDPLRNPLLSLRMAMAFPIRIPVLFEGAHLASDGLPASYVAELVVLTTPLPELLLAGAGLLLAVHAAGNRPQARATPALILVMAWLVLPVAAFAVARPNIYDGMRHFLFVRPAVALLAAYAFARLAIALRAAAGAPVATAAASLVALLALSPVVDLVRMHPYQATWFNGLAGGMAGAWTRFDTDTGALAYREGMEWITAADARRPLRVLVAASDYSRPAAERYAPPGVTVEALWEGGIDGALPGALPEGIDYYLATTRVGLASNYAGAPIVHAVGREGAIFAIVRGRADTPPASAPGADSPGLALR